VSPLQEPASARPVVVIVDDDPAIRNSLAFSLRTEGIAVLAYASGAELLNELPASGTGCLVIDYKLPGMNGLDLLAELRRRQIATPAILITTHPSAAVRERAATSGTALIEKPLLGDALFAEIRAALAA
jgi:two-component system, LuxR family, response regulator FixJ